MRYILSRLMWLPIVLWSVASLTFLVLRLVPGDPMGQVANLILDPAQVERTRAAWGLDQPIWRQYVVFLGNLLQGDLGVSMASGLPITRLLFEKLPPTIELAVVSMLIATIIGVGVGILSATTSSRAVDYTGRSLAVLGMSVPWFWIAIMFIYLFSVRMRWFPVGGRIGIGVDYTTITNFILLDQLITGNVEAFISALRHITLPALAIGLTSAGFIMRMTRSSMLEVLRQDYIRSAHAKGLRNGTVTYGHALRNALLPVLTILGLQFGALLGGAVITEIVFSWPGMGRMMLDGILRRDYAVVQGTVIVVAAFYVIVNFAVDISYHMLDPRLRRS
jgi:peptide/nickel transport system permease protein